VKIAGTKDMIGNMNFIRKRVSPAHVRKQHKLLSKAINTLDQFLEDGGCHFFPMEYDAYDLDSEIKGAKNNISYMKKPHRKRI